jgi:predicted RND superfamily exporter protein
MIPPRCPPSAIRCWPVAPQATGAPISIRESGRTIVGAFVEAGILSFIAIIILLAVVLKRADDVMRTLAPLVLAGLLTLGSCVALNLKLNFANIIALPLLLGIGVAFNIYFVVAWRAGAKNFLQSALTRAVIFLGPHHGDRLRHPMAVQPSRHRQHGRTA